MTGARIVGGNRAGGRTGDAAARTRPEPRPRRLTPTRASLAARGLVAAIVIVALLAAVVAYGNGYFDDDPEITAEVPAEAGLIIGHVGVQYDGVHVGEVTSIDAGTTRSLVHMSIEHDEIGRIPAGALVRVVPRTLFGDVYLRLVPDPAAAPARDHLRRDHLRDGDRLATDTSPDAVQLYDVYQQAVTLMDGLQPAKMQTALTAMADALRGQGDELGSALERFAGAADELVPVATTLLDHAPQMATVAEAARDATPDMLGISRDMTRLSQLVLDRPDGLAGLLEAGGAAAATVSAVAREESDRVVDVIGRSAPVLSTTADGREGLATTFDLIRAFSAKGARVFATGRFDITTVPSFADPEPYTAADCPRYGALAGANCLGAAPGRSGGGR